jgi:hypothetical protein
VEYLYREAPEETPKGDPYPDSGWCIRGRKGSATNEEMDARAIAYVALGAVLNRDDSWIGWIGAPVGTRLFRDSATGSYVEED